MNSVESTESVELKKIFLQKMCIRTPTSCVTSQYATTVPARHM